MSDSIISVEGLSKRYSLGFKRKHRNLCEAFINTVKAPFKRLAARGQGSSEDFWALKNVNFEVQRGDVVGIIGRNGAGKSTLLKILSHITPPTHGEITLRGRVASLLEVGTGFHPELTGRENVFLNGAILGMKRAEIRRKFDEIVDFSGVGKFLETPVKRYSSGMQVRLAFAVAAHLEPEILVVDEVLAVGDAEFQQKCLGKMKEVSSRAGRTVLFVSHNMAAVRTLCSHGVQLQHGSIMRTGTAHEVVDNYMQEQSRRGTTIISEFKKPTGASIWMTSACLVDNDKPVSTLPLGADLTLQIHFEAESPIRQPKFGFVLSSMVGTRLIGANNRYQPSPKLTESKQTGTIVCRLGQVPLMPGNYNLSFYLGDAAVDTHIEIDGLNFTITERDIWGFGQLPPAASEMWWPTQFDLF